jgi:hypothetical protein
MQIIKLLQKRSQKAVHSPSPSTGEGRLVRRSWSGSGRFSVGGDEGDFKNLSTPFMPTNIKTLKDVGIVLLDTLPLSSKTLIGRGPYVPTKPLPQGARAYCYSLLSEETLIILR